MQRPPRFKARSESNACAAQGFRGLTGGIFMRLSELDGRFYLCRSQRKPELPEKGWPLFVFGVARLSP